MFSIDDPDYDLKVGSQFRFRESLFGKMILQVQMQNGQWRDASRSDWVIMGQNVRAKMKLAELQAIVVRNKDFPPGVLDALKAMDVGKPGQIKVMGANGLEWRDPPDAYGTAGVQSYSATPPPDFQDTTPLYPKRAENREGWSIGDVKFYNRAGEEVPHKEDPPGSGYWVRDSQDRPLRATEAEVEEMNRPRTGFEVVREEVRTRGFSASGREEENLVTQEFEVKVDNYGTDLKPGEAGTYSTGQGQVTVTVAEDGTRLQTFHRPDQIAMPDHPAGSVEDDRLFQLLTPAQQEQLLNVRAFSNSQLTVPQYLNALVMYGDIKQPGLLLLDSNHNPTTPEQMEDFRVWMNRGRDGFQP